MSFPSPISLRHLLGVVMFSSVPRNLPVTRELYRLQSPTGTSYLWPQHHPTLQPQSATVQSHPSGRVPASPSNPFCTWVLFAIALAPLKALFYAFVSPSRSLTQLSHSQCSHGLAHNSAPCGVQHHLWLGPPPSDPFFSSWLVLLLWPTRVLTGSEGPKRAIMQSR